MLRSDLAVSDEQFANVVLATPIFETKKQLAARVLARHWPPDFIEDALQEAALNIYFYLSKNRAEEFSGTTNDAFGAWLYSLILQHGRWAVAKIIRGERRRKRREKLVSALKLERSSEADRFDNALSGLLAASATFPKPLSIVARDWLLDIPVKDTAHACHLSERRIFELRHKVAHKIQKVLDDMF